MIVLDLNRALDLMIARAERIAVPDALSASMAQSPPPWLGPAVAVYAPISRPGHAATPTAAQAAAPAGAAIVPAAA